MSAFPGGSMAANMWASLVEHLRGTKEQFDRERFRPYAARHQLGGREREVWVTDPTARAWYDGDRDLPGEFRFLA